MEGLIANRYQIIELLGRGTFGEVYLTSDLRLGVNRVVKLSEPDIDAHSLAVIEREAMVSARLFHPSIVSVVDFGTTADRRAFLVREYVKGETLEQILAKLRQSQNRLAQSEAFAVIRSIAEGIEAAHEQNIIHRDLKPSNVIVPEADGKFVYEKARILDFGVFGELVKVKKYAEATTMVGDLFGTPLYMSPEQMRAEAQTTATDVYGLGMLLFETIYNQLPFDRSSIAEMIRVKIQGEINFPADETVSPKIVALLRKCLAPDQKERIQTAREFLERIGRIDGLAAATKSHIPPFDVQHEYLSQGDDSHKPTVTLNEPPTPWSGDMPSQSAEPTIFSEVPIVPKTEALPQSAAASPLMVVLCYIVVGLFIVPGIFLLGLFLWHFGFLTWQIFGGVVFVLLGIAAGFAVRHLIGIRQSEIGKDAQDLLFGANSRDIMTQSLAVQVQLLISKLSRVDDRILGMSLAIMVREFGETKEDSKRTDVLMNVVQLLEKISLRLSPWYVRHEKLVAVVVAMFGILSGVATITINIINTAKGK